MQNKFLTREISWLSFNARVLQEASDPTLPLKQRIRFLGIYSNNRDEFFRVRVSMLTKMIMVYKKKKSYFQKNPQKIYDQIHSVILQQQEDFNRIWKKILVNLAKENVFLLDSKHLNAKQKAFVRDFFDQEVSSSIIPLFFENMPKLPSYWDENFFLGVVMKKDRESSDQRFAMIEIPTKIHSRFVSLPSAPGVQNLMLLEEVIRFNLPRLFSHSSYTYFEAHTFKMTKDAEINIDQDLSTPFIQKIEKGVKNRRKAPAIRFLYDHLMNRDLLNLLIQKLNLSNKDSIIPGGDIRNFRDFMDFPAILPNGQSRPRPFQHPIFAKSMSICDVILKQDVLLHLPYHSFNTVIDMLREAAMDPNVISIKITAYRLTSNSKICNALINAVRNGKEVHVVLELRAYGDEKANLEWKSKLEDEGVKVYLGIPNMKVHTKICVIKKKVGNHIQQYGFVSTGNLNEKTALSYIDHYLLTSNRNIMADVNRIFEALENPESNWKKQLGLCKTLLVSPINMRKALLSKIEREIKFANAGISAKIILNINSLSDEKLIKKIYKSATAGVEIQLIVRGIFSVDIDKDEFPQPITAISIVDEYLEHSRIWFFQNDGNEEIFIASADWMARNLDSRIEAAVMIRDPSLKEELKHILKIKLSDNVKARLLDRELSNQYVTSNRKKVRSQEAIYHYLKRLPPAKIKKDNIL